MAAVNVLKHLKEEFQKITGTVYDANKEPVGCAAPVKARNIFDFLTFSHVYKRSVKINKLKYPKKASQPPAAPAGNDVLALWEQTNAVGTKIRDMKSKKASKEEITAAVAELKDC